MARDLVKEVMRDRVKFSYVISILALGLFAYLLLYRLGIVKLHALQQIIAERKGNLRILRTISEYKDYVEKFNTDFTVNVSENKLLDIIADIAKENLIELGMIKSLGSSDIGGYRNLHVLVEGTSSYNNMIDFITDLERGTDYFIVSNFDLRAKQIAGSQHEKFPKNTEPPSYKKRMADFKLMVTCFSKIGP